MAVKRVFQTFPQLETSNLLLRRIVPEDAEALYKILSDDEVTEYYDDDSFTDVSQAGDQIAAWEMGFKDQRSIRWGITHKGEMELVGTCGYYGFHTWYQRAAIGYELARSYWRQGIMTEAVNVMLEFGFEKLELNRVQALVMPGNVASLHMLEKLGFQNEGVLKEYEIWGSKGYVDLCMIALLRKDWGGSRT
jgi:ribosomal-protein-alanine N-acetyltransferase